MMQQAKIIFRAAVLYWSCWKLRVQNLSFYFKLSWLLFHQLIVKGKQNMEII
jgi:hypothetical protein